VIYAGAFGVKDRVALDWISFLLFLLFGSRSRGRKSCWFCCGVRNRDVPGGFGERLNIMKRLSEGILTMFMIE